MKIWVVGISNAEGGEHCLLCATKDIAVRELFKKRDELIAGWKEMEEYTKKSFCPDGMYQRMIDNLSGDDYENWNNYPQDYPWIMEEEVRDQ